MSSFLAMPIDKSWISKSRNTPEYADGLRQFFFPKCGFNKWQRRDIVEEHLILKPFPKNYKFWYWHGEESNATVQQISQSTHVIEDNLQPQDPMEIIINDAFGFTRNNVNELGISSNHINREEIFDEGHIEGHNEDYIKFYELVEDGNQPLYEGCTKYSKLSFLIKLYHIKFFYRMANKVMSMILELLKDVFEDAKIPSSFYEARKTINKLGLNYTKIHARSNDCMLYFGEDEELQEFKRCKTSRWKDNKKKQPAKILRYFSLKLRLQRLFMCYKTVESMRWHSLEGCQDGLMRHHRESQAWKTFDLCHPEFVADPRNI